VTINRLEELIAELREAVESEQALTTIKVLSVSHELDEVILDIMHRLDGRASVSESDVG